MNITVKVGPYLKIPSLGLRSVPRYGPGAPAGNSGKYFLRTSHSVNNIQDSKDTSYFQSTHNTV